MCNYKKATNNNKLNKQCIKFISLIYHIDMLDKNGCINKSKYSYLIHKVKTMFRNIVKKCCKYSKYYRLLDNIQLDIFESNLDKITKDAITITRKANNVKSFIRLTIIKINRLAYKIYYYNHIIFDSRLKQYIRKHERYFLYNKYNIYEKLNYSLRGC